jgi:hypothetical protein
MISGDIGGSARPGVEADSGDTRESMERAEELAYPTSTCIIAVASWKICCIREAWPGVAAGRRKGVAGIRLRPTLGVRASSSAADLVCVPINSWEKARDDCLRGGSNGASTTISIRMHSRETLS